MTGPEHYREAERLIGLVESRGDGADGNVELLAAAQAHATLALTAATAAEQATKWDGDEDGSRGRCWSGVIG